LRAESRGFEADGSNQGIAIVDDTLIEAIEIAFEIRAERGL
jgi:hypothetical protein